MKNKELSQRFYKFALRVVKFVQSLPKNWVALEIGRQLLRSGTSVDANYEEACGAFSKSDFTYKLNISFKEAKESHYWLRLLYDSEIVMNEERNIYSENQKRFETYSEKELKQPELVKNESKTFSRFRLFTYYIFFTSHFLLIKLLWFCNKEVLCQSRLD